MPGITITTETVSGPSTSLRAPAATYFVVGQAERGPTDEAILVRSLAEFERTFGPRVAYGALHDDLAAFFGEGGSRAYVARVVGPAATKGTLTLNDQAGVPVATLRIDASSAGAWSSDVTIDVDAGNVAGTFDVIVTHVPTGDRERFLGLTSPANAAEVISAQSRYVDAVDLGSATAAPNNNPAPTAATALSAGTDDRAAITGTTYTGALARFVEGLGAGAVAIPGQTAATVGGALAAHASANRRIALLAPGKGSTVADARSAVTALALGDTDARHAGLFYPWVRVPAGNGLTRLISPEGAVAGLRARAHIAEGPYQAPAGQANGQARYVIGLEAELTRTQGDELDEDRVSAFRTITDRPTLYGWRSLSTDESNYGILTGIDTVNLLVAQADQGLEAFVFRTIDGRGHLFAEVEAVLVGLAEPMRARGGLFERIDPDSGEVLDLGYRVDVGPSVNTVDSTAAGIIRAVLAVRVSPTGTLVEVTIAKVAVTAAL